MGEAARELLARDPEWAAKLAKRCQRAARKLIPIIRNVARAHGYAVGVHGSLKRDIDLIAAPWTSDAASPEVLVEAIRDAVDGFVRHDAAFTAKPHGRLSWVILLGGGPYIDLSIMPTKAT